MTKESTYKVGGMSCGGCAASVERAVAALAPKARVSVDWQAGTLAVHEGLSEDMVKQAVEGAGFDYLGRA